MFLHAAKADKIQPEHCVVVEDSVSGFEAAANAGMNCFAYLPMGEEPKFELFGAQPFYDMKMLPTLLGLV